MAQQASFVILSVGDVRGYRDEGAGTTRIICDDRVREMGGEEGVIKANSLHQEGGWAGSGCTPRLHGVKDERGAWRMKDANIGYGIDGGGLDVGQDEEADHETRRTP